MSSSYFGYPTDNMIYVQIVCNGFTNCVKISQTNILITINWNIFVVESVILSIERNSCIVFYFVIVFC